MKAVIREGDTLREYGGKVLGGHYLLFGMNGVLGVERDNLPDDIPQTFTTELGYYTGLQPATPQQGNRHVTYTFD